MPSRGLTEQFNEGQMYICVFSWKDAVDQIKWKGILLGIYNQLNINCQKCSTMVLFHLYDVTVWLLEFSESVGKWVLL